tara:strand:- start:701 stop:2047 length:1347 start_codon:yes stop_codon:yes gene_type:complete
MDVVEKLKQIKSGKLSAEKNVKSFLDKIKKENSKINAVVVVNQNAISDARTVDGKKSKGKLAGLGFIVKSNICVKGLECNCASKTLAGWKAPYDSTVVSKIRAEDGVILGMANMDEFASGASGETSAFGVCKNPASLDLIPGGSSSGSASSIAAGFCDVALGSDTGGSIRNPASHCGVVGVKPSYGLVSRYGLIDLAMSFDQIGVLSRDIESSSYVLDIIAGRDEKDPTTFDSSGIKIGREKNLTIGLLKNNSDSAIQELVNSRVREVAEKNGWKVKEIDLKYLDLGIQTYYLIVYTEFFSGTRKFDGRRFGKKIEDVAGPEVVRRIIGGGEITRAEYGGRYYKKALEVKELIRKEFERAFAKVDCIISPTVPKLPHRIGSSISTKEMYAYDSLTVPASLAGVCAVSVPVGKVGGVVGKGEGVPVGLQVMCNSFEEGKMFGIAREFEK